MRTPGLPPLDGSSPSKGFIPFGPYNLFFRITLKSQRSRSRSFRTPVVSIRVRTAQERVRRPDWQDQKSLGDIVRSADALRHVTDKGRPRPKKRQSSRPMCRNPSSGAVVYLLTTHSYRQYLPPTEGPGSHMSTSSAVSGVL